MVWIGERASEAYCFTDHNNTASLALHRSFGFEVIAKDVWFRGILAEDRMILLRSSTVRVL
jgi:hypothetical protein